MKKVPTILIFVASYCAFFSRLHSEEIDTRYSFLQANDRYFTSLSKTQNHLAVKNVKIRDISFVEMQTGVSFIDKSDALFGTSTLSKCDFVFFSEGDNDTAQISTISGMPTLSELNESKSLISRLFSSNFIDDFYTTDGTLTGDRFVDLGNATLSFGKGVNKHLHLFNNGNLWIGSGTPVDNGYRMDVNGSVRFSYGNNFLRFNESGTVFFSVGGAAGTYIQTNSGNTYTTIGGSSGMIQTKMTSAYGTANYLSYTEVDGVLTIGSGQGNSSSNSNDGVILRKGYFGNIGTGTKHILRITNNLYSNINSSEILKGVFIDLKTTDGPSTLSVSDLRALETSVGNVLFGTTSGNVGIGINTNIHPSAILDITSTNKGVLLPRLTSSQRTAINSPAAGLIGYQTDNTENLYIYKSTGWKRIMTEDDASGLSSFYSSNGVLTGNRFVDLGTSSTLSFGKGAATNLHLFNNGNIWIGNGTPQDNSYRLEVNGVIRTTSVPRFDGGGVIINRNGSEAYLNFQKDGTQLAQIRLSATGQLKFTDGGGGSVHNLFSQHLVQLAGSTETIAKVNTSGGSSVPAFSANYIVGYTPNGNFYPLIVRQSAPTIEMADGFGTGIAFYHHDISNINNQVAGILTERTGNDGASHLKFLTANGSGLMERIRISNTGNLLVGTTIDDGINKLQVNGRVKFAGLQTDNTYTKIVVSDETGNLFLRDISTVGGSGGGSWQTSGTNLFNNNSGFVGIGTSTPQSELSVNGVITTKKVKVTQAGWPDFVFASDYRLATLQEVELFIQKNKHLPGIVSATEVETNGLDLGDNQAALLQKIEELTLYLIEMNKRVEQLERENEKLKTKTKSRK